MRRLCSIALWMAAPCLVYARIINVPAEYSTIQAGINASNNGDTVLVQPGVYTENINFSGHEIVLGSTFLTTGDTMIIAATIIDGGAAGTVVTFSNADDATVLSGLTIRNGRAFEGGGIYCDGASPTIINNIITENSMMGDGSWGGGILCADNSGPIIAFNWIIGNRAGFGAGIASYNSSPVIDRNFITGNAATWSEVGGNGGGIYCNGPSTPIIRGNDIRSDSAYWGGAGIACLNNVQAMIEGNTISGNVGGGIQLGTGNSILMHNIISNNSTQLVGGGIKCYDFSGDISNNVIVGNSAADGGGIHCYSQQFAPSIANNVIYGNSSGIFVHGSGLTIVNSIFWENESYQIRLDSASSSSITYCDIQGGWAGQGNIDADPIFVDPSTSDFHLMSVACGNPYDSPCIDTGHPDSLDGELHCLAGLGTARSDMGGFGGGGNMTGVGDGDPISAPRGMELLPNYPNPFNSRTTIRFSLPNAGSVTLDIYDILGRKIESVFSGYLQAGEHSMVWAAGAMPSGIYFHRLYANSRALTGKMTLLK